jgi:transposase
MKNLRLYAGLDYSDAFVQVCLLDEQGQQIANCDCANHARAIQAFAERYGTVVEAAIESCTGAANLAEELISTASWSVSLAHPGYVARIKQSPDKTDYQDARLLADLVRVGYLPRVWLAPENIRELRRLVRYRQDLARQRRNAKLQVRALLRDQRCAAPAAAAWTRAWMQWLLHHAKISEQSRFVVGKQVQRLAQLAQEIKEVEERLAALTASDGEVARLLKQPGIGPVTAWTLRAEIGRFDRFRTGKQLARFCGLSPRNASSGQRQADAGLVKAANPSLRSLLIEAAHRLGRLHPQWKALRNRLRQRGKPGSVIAAAIANRWVRKLYHEMRTTTTPTAAA